MTCRQLGRLESLLSPTIVSIYNFTKGLVNLGNFKYFLRPEDYLLSELCKFCLLAASSEPPSSFWEELF